ncbi:MAG: hypothetical protein CV045_07270 [Cyanobacteria bacterium M5B4]|nr:MAG: hypothetical protein CV045_07270 [Cyanobacteria bacterium M5B4]
MEWAFVLFLCICTCLPVAAKPIEQLADGRYIFASQLPKTDRHPDIQLAGAEVYAFEKTDRNLLGEIFIANSSEASCFVGRVSQNLIQGKAIIAEYPQRQVINFTKDLSDFYPVSPQLLPYARSSVERCRPVFVGHNNLRP